MNLNLARPWSIKGSPPQNPNLSFFCAESPNFIFEQNPRKVRIYCQVNVKAISMSWSLHLNQIRKEFRTGKAEPLPANLFLIDIDTRDLPPGFYDLRIAVDTGLKEPEEGVCTFGIDPTEMPMSKTRPDDFSRFWETALDQSAEIPLDPRIEDTPRVFTAEQIDAYNRESANLPARYDPGGIVYDKVESYKISFKGPEGKRVYGWLAKPVGDGPFPAMLVLPGAGFAARPRPLEHARHGYVALDIQIHGQDVDLENYEKLAGYYKRDQVYDPVEANYFHNVYLRAQRAVDLLASRPDVLPGKLAAVGGSQGGRLSVIVAALDPRVTAIVSCIANSGNEPHLRWEEDLNEAKTTPIPGTDPIEMFTPPSGLETARGQCVAYYDPMNFAPDVECPVLMNAGLIDPISPAYSVWGIYNRLGTDDKEIVPLAGLGHDWSAEFDRLAWRWLDEQFQLRH
ncbi:acetylxylan esterase [Puniceicoccus vermicola]|nr:acetylxylan esterase [Puniceicoccus vermicola]